MTDPTFPASRGGKITMRDVATRDGFANFEAAVGLGTDNQASSARYTSTPITRQRMELELMYRNAWIVRQTVGVVADDMTRAGVTFRGTDQVDQLQNALRRCAAWGRLAEGVRWGRLFGGAIVIMLIDGQDMATELRPETVPRGAFKGLTVYDRWLVQPSNELISEPGPYYGKPVAYRLIGGFGIQGSGQIVHHSRCIRLEGEDLPYYQRQYEWGWGMSVVEPFYDRLIAFDSTTIGMAQLVYKAHLRTLKVKNLRILIAAGGNPSAQRAAQDGYNGLLGQVAMMRRFQTNEGLTLLDGEDDFKSETYTFAGLPDVLMQMSQQVSGATGIPLVKLFGMSPAGFSTGDADLRSYYDNIALRQEQGLRHPLEMLFRIVHHSEFGQAPADDFGFEFDSLWGLSDQEKATIAQNRGTIILAAEAAQVITGSQALRELQAVGRDTGVFASITDEMVTAKEAEEAQAQPSELDDPPGAETALTPSAEEPEAVEPPEHDGARDGTVGSVPAFLRRVA